MNRKSKKTRLYADLRRERLMNPEVAAEYLNATRKNSPENFLNALRNVAQARSMTCVAKEAGVQRETLYRSLSENGNPTITTLESVLGACGLEISVRVQGEQPPRQDVGGTQTENLNFRMNKHVLIVEKCFDALITSMNNAQPVVTSGVTNSSSIPSLHWVNSGGLRGNVHTEN